MSRFLAIPIALLGCTLAFGYTKKIHHVFTGPGSFVLTHNINDPAPHVICAVSDPATVYNLSFTTSTTATVSVDRATEISCTFTTTNWGVPVIEQ